MNERPVCHRAEDLVTYLYGEATAAEEGDFAAHLQQCDACRAEFSVFNQVHESIVTWRNEALGSSFAPAAAPVAQTVLVSGPFAQPARKLSALAALREFFTVSPLWLRGATAFAGVLLCVLVVLAASRLWQPTEVADNQLKYSEEQLNQKVQKLVDERVAAALAEQKSPDVLEASQDEPRLTVNRPRPKNRRTKGFSQEEREQLAADLGLIPGRDEELPFVLPEAPNQ